MERILLDVSFWEINFIDITKLKPENYINFWRLINTEQYQFGEEHVNIASSLANIFVGQDLFPLFEEFLREIDSEKLRLLKKDEQFLRALIKLKMHENSFSEVYSLIQVIYIIVILLVNGVLFKNTNICFHTKNPYLNNLVHVS